ncbi:hypothetical protein J1N35_010664 [Gossypium stocksii]|uniref:Reverse transcriptase zinc-binding domain-containing protein n=1 Tax=Gossypium stocksii TaxID=47602 RepID=A0A9D3W0G6_9ROSI|nr:hypothetical protein J1N35_010664 [Gossypium stocksii]
MSRQWWTNNEKTRGWVMMECAIRKFKDTLCFKVLSAKYFPEGDVLRPKSCARLSFTWSIIAKAIDALKDGFLWQIKDGNCIDIRRDQWGFEGLNGDSVCRCKSEEESLLYAMKECPKVREILMIGGLNNRLINVKYEQCVDWLEDVLQELDKKVAADFFTLL